MKQKGKYELSVGFITKTGGGFFLDQLSELEIILTSVYGKNHFDRQQGIHECGFPDQIRLSGFVFTYSIHRLTG